MTKLINHTYGIVCVLVAVFAAIPPDAFDVIPHEWKPYIIGASGVALWLKSHWNLFVNPDGTPATVGYEAPPK